MCRKDTDNAHLLLMFIDLLFVYALAQVYYFGTAGKKGLTEYRRNEIPFIIIV